MDENKEMDVANEPVDVVDEGIVDTGVLYDGSCKDPDCTFPHTHERRHVRGAHALKVESDD